MSCYVYDTMSCIKGRELSETLNGHLKQALIQLSGRQSRLRHGQEYYVGLDCLSVHMHNCLWSCHDACQHMQNILLMEGKKDIIIYQPHAFASSFFICFFETMW